MSVEPTAVEPVTHPLRANTNLHLRPFAKQMAEQCPGLWARFIRACERERVTEGGLSPEEFINRCTTTARGLNDELDNELVAERSN